MSVYCDGEAARSPTVVLIPAESDKAPVKLQSVDEVVDDLHGWLKASGEKGPFILVIHSISGFYALRFVKRYPREAAGLVFVDSSHEEQALRLHELDPRGPGLDEVTARLGFYVKPGERLERRTELPLIVLGRGTPFPRKARDGSDSQTNRMTEEQFTAWDRIWRELQGDLAKRSTHGSFGSLKAEKKESTLHPARSTRADYSGTWMEGRFPARKASIAVADRSNACCTK